MSNADLIEVIKTLADSIAKEAADALAAADKRIEELEKYGRVQDPLADRIAGLERKLAVAREALKAAEWNSLDLPEFVRVEIAEALAQIGDGDAGT